MQTIPEWQQAIIDKSYHPTGIWEEFLASEYESSIPARFEKIVARFPGRLAILDDQRSLSYAELNAAANRVAHGLLARLGPGSEPVIHLFDQSVDAVVAILGIVKAGKFYVPLDVHSPDDSLRRTLTQQLPPQMIPSRFVFLERFPLNRNHKVDRKNLPSPEQSRPRLDIPLVAPQTPLEEEVAQIWRNTLQIEEIGIHDPFLELGGNSLQAMRIPARVQAEFGVEIPLAELFAAGTVAKLLLGLYTPESGQIEWNGQPVTEQCIDDYRQLFSVIFADFFLFDQLLGLEEMADDEEAQVYLKKLQLSHKVRMNNGNLSTLDLSTGQRQRLALLTAYLEDRPVYLFDEWAAGQDPEFKELFYRQLLPELRNRGKLVIVISHDDHYYDTADRIVKLDFGQVEYDRKRMMG